MQIDWAHFTPASAVAGGALIGVAAVALHVLEGEIMGVSGITAGAVRTGSGWRRLFLVGLVGVALVLNFFAAVPGPMMAVSAPILCIAGFLTGFGARLGSGCTSGHGVCGLSRLSPRSWVAVPTFMAAAMLCVFIERHGAAFLSWGR